MKLQLHIVRYRVGAESDLLGRADDKGHGERYSGCGRGESKQV